MTEAVDDKGDMKRDQGNRCCLGKSSREGDEKTKREIAVEKRKVVTDGGRNKIRIDKRHTTMRSIGFHRL